MRQIEFMVDLAGKEVRVLLSDPHPKGQHWQVIINHVYHGTITKRSGRWIGHLNARTDLQADDIQALGEWIERSYPEK